MFVFWRLTEKKENSTITFWPFAVPRGPTLQSARKRLDQASHRDAVPAGRVIVVRWGYTERGQIVPAGWRCCRLIHSGTTTTDRTAWSHAGATACQPPFLIRSRHCRLKLTQLHADKELCRSHLPLVVIPWRCVCHLITVLYASVCIFIHSQYACTVECVGQTNGVFSRDLIFHNNYCMQ